jgi:ribonuclease HI
VVLDQLNIRDWDVLLFGDGSGHGWGIGCGWSCILIDRLSRSRKMLYGSMNSGTVNVGELMAYVHAMLWYSGQIAKAGTKKRPLNVHVVTDSRVIANQGTAVELAGNESVANRALWMSMKALSRQGFVFHYHWIERLTVELNWGADQMAGKARIALNDLVLEDFLPDAEDKHPAVSIYT